MSDDQAQPAGTAVSSIESALRRGVKLHVEGRLRDAESCYAEVLRLDPGHVHGNYLLGLIALLTDRPGAAAELIGKAVALGAADAEIHVNHGIALNLLGRPEDALECFRRAATISPYSPDAHEHLGNALGGLGRWQAAHDAFTRALAADPNRAGVLVGRGTAAYHLRQFDRAIDDFDRAIALDPTGAANYNNRGNVRRELLQYAAAVADYDKAIALQPTYAEAHYNRANALRDSAQYEAAIAGFRAASSLKPTLRSVRTLKLYTQLQICDWSDYPAEIGDYERRLESGEEIGNPFFVLALSGSGAVQKRAAENWVRHSWPASDELGGIDSYPRHERPRVAYLSADFHDHATTHLMAELFELHDRRAVDVTLISFGRSAADAMTARIMRAGAEFIDARTLSDAEIAMLCRRRQIDIAVDLKGFTQEMRLRIFALRAAPIQVSYLGYPGTMGAPYMDYLIADHELVPPGTESRYAEKIVFMPDSYQVNDRTRRIDERVFSRAELGLPESGFVFCCFNNIYKITPGVFGAWMRILGRVAGSVLWLLADGPTSVRNLRAAARASGHDERRLVFAEHMPPALHRARQRAADLFLDTSPYGAHTTASDALWAGLPLLTRAGESFAGRVAASLLKAVGLPELITHTWQDYEESAVELAGDADLLGTYRQRLERRRLECPLFDTPRFARHLESGYVRMYERLQSGLAPDHIRIGR
jgi:predicted O-linked N-acetylglucosamine transferase (SPINDLY family)/Flp pilus assembly protein TadD